MVNKIETGLQENQTPENGEILHLPVTEVLQQTRNQIRVFYSSIKQILGGDNKFYTAIAIAAALHLPVVFPNTGTQLKNIAEDTYASITSDIPARYKELIERDIESINQRNTEKIKRIEANSDTTQDFKSSLKAKLEKGEDFSYSQAYFEMERLSQGVSPEVINSAKGFFSWKINDLQKEKPQKPTKEFLIKILQTFTPGKAYESTRTSAMESLALKVAPGTQNCKSRSKILIMALNELYPDRKDDILVQTFGDHTRIIFQTDQKKWVMELTNNQSGQADIHELEEDSVHKNKTSVIAPAKARFQVYSGAPVTGREVVNRGPKGADKPYTNATDDLIGDDITEGLNINLGNYGSLEKTYERELKTKNAPKITNVENQIAKIIEEAHKPMELTLLKENNYTEKELGDWLFGNLPKNLQNPSVATIARLKKVMDKIGFTSTTFGGLADYKDKFTPGEAMDETLPGYSDKSFNEIIKQFNDPKYSIGFLAFEQNSLTNIAKILGTANFKGKIIISYHGSITPYTLELLKPIFQNKNLNIEFRAYGLYPRDILNPESSKTLLELIQIIEKSKVKILLGPDRYMATASINPSILENPRFIVQANSEDRIERIWDILYTLEFKGNIDQKNIDRVINVIKLKEQEYYAKNPKPPEGQRDELAYLSSPEYKEVLFNLFTKEASIWIKDVVKYKIIGD